jgi:predicted phosphodiesterase
MRIAVLSDIHANVHALDAVVAAVGAVDRWWHCGDVVGYGPHPNEVVARLRELDAVGVLGNHDAAALGSPIIEWFNPYAVDAALWTRGTLTPDARDWLAALPEQVVVDGWTIVHGSARDPLQEYVTSGSVALATMRHVPTRTTLHGHTHVPRAWRADDDMLTVEDAGRPDATPLPLGDGRWLLNPGSVGQPRDGDRRAAAMVIDTVSGDARWLRVEYPIARVQADMRRAGLPERLATRLDVGR